ncbi:hypothetical protein GcC1_162012, partial [Golovinomyces cichoracearum]
MLLRGLTAIDKSGTTFYALIFDNAEHMERGIVKITKSVFKWSGVNVKLVAHCFGDPQARSNSVWQIASEPLLSGNEMINNICEHLKLLDPELRTQFSLRKVMKGNYHNAKWAVNFSGPTPAKFVKQMICGNEKDLITQEPFSTCRFCGNSGHTLFECTDKTELELGPE